MNTPVALVRPVIVLIVHGCAWTGLVVEIVVGFKLIAWWAGIFLWIPAWLLAETVFFGLVHSNNPAPRFYMGVALALVGLVIIGRA
jgi:hypothetical protein